MLQLPLSIDLTHQQDVLKLVPRPPLLTSEAASWNNILVQYHQQPAWDMPENRTAQHVVVVHHQMEQSVNAHRVMDGRKQQEALNYGSCIIIPGNTVHQSSWGQDAHFTLLILEPAYLAQIAHETVDNDRVELMPHFAQQDPMIASIGAALTAELTTHTSEGTLYAESAATFLAAHLLQHYCTRPQSLQPYGGGLPKCRLREAIAYIETHLGEEISLEAIASHVNMSQYYFCHLFKQSMGVSPYQYVLRQRIDKAKTLLKQRQFAIIDVALECGFANQTHFTKHFRKFTGTTPRSYREQ